MTPIQVWIDSHVELLLVVLAAGAGYLAGTATPRRKRRRR